MVDTTAPSRDQEMAQHAKEGFLDHGDGTGWVPAPSMDPWKDSSIAERMGKMEERIRKILTGTNACKRETDTKPRKISRFGRGGEGHHSSALPSPALKTPDVIDGPSRWRRNRATPPSTPAPSELDTREEAEQPLQHEGGGHPLEYGSEKAVRTSEGGKGTPNREALSNEKASGVCANGERWDIAKVLGEVCIEERFLKEVEDEMNLTSTAGTHGGGTVHRNEAHRSELLSSERRMDISQGHLQRLEEAKAEIQRLEVRVLESEERFVQSTMRCADLEEQVASLERAIHAERKKTAKQNHDAQASSAKLEEFFKLQRENSMLKVREQQIAEALSEQSSLVASLKSRLQALSPSPNKTKQIEGKLRQYKQEAQEARNAADKALQQVAELSRRNCELESIIRAQGPPDLSLASTASPDDLMEALYK